MNGSIGRVVRDIGGVLAAFVGGWAWCYYVAEHCTSKLDPTETPPSVVSLCVLVCMAGAVSVMFTRHWVVPVFVGLLPLGLLYMNFVNGRSVFSLSWRVLLLTMTIPPLLMIGGCMAGARLRKRLWPIGGALFRAN